MAEFTYNNTRNTSTDYNPFELNYGFYLRVSNKEDVDSHFRSKTVNRLVPELQPLCLCVGKIFSILKRFRNVTIISMQILRIMPKWTKFG